MKTQNMNHLMDLVKNLSDEEQKELVNSIMNMLQTPMVPVESKNASCHEMVAEHLGDRPDCPHCHAKASLGYVVKHGYKNGVQRFYCKSCNHHFVATTNTAFERSRKDADTWRKFIRMTIVGATLIECAEKCELSYQTAFTWRHKILNVFKVNQQSTMMAGQIQLDEMLIPISYKGNHMKGNFHSYGKTYENFDNGLPRASYKRGSDNKSTSSKQKACVFCMVEDKTKSFYAAVPGVGFMQPNMLDKTLGEHVMKEKSLVVADLYKVTAKYLENNEYRYMTLASNTSDNYHDHKPQILNGNHMQNVNAMHRHIRMFLTKYCGVATKYLEDYLSLFVWLKNVAANKQKRKMQKVTLNRASTADCYISRKGIESLPMVPSAA